VTDKIHCPKCDEDFEMIWDLTPAIQRCPYCKSIYIITGKEASSND